MSKTIVSIILLFFGFSYSSAQDSRPKSKWKFNSANQVGLLQGEGNTAASLQTINGFRLHRFFAGVGTGVDYYRYRSIPLFASARLYLGSLPNQFYIYGDGGTNFVWQERNTNLYGSKETYRPGFFGGAGIGYSAGLKNGMGITLSAGYTCKKVTNIQQEISSCPFMGPCVLSAQTYRYNLNRLIFQLGWVF
jgi:hypothetical protein